MGSAALPPRRLYHAVLIYKIGISLLRKLPTSYQVAGLPKSLILQYIFSEPLLTFEPVSNPVQIIDFIVLFGQF